jgi:hypothetical protein
LVADYLSDLGYQVRTQRFTFALSSLDAFPIFGAGLGGLAIAISVFLVSERLPAWWPLCVWGVGLVALSLIAGGVGLGWVPLGRGVREDANLLATRGAGPPRRWIMAHLDSKAQGHSMAGRLVAVWLVAGSVSTLTILTLLRLRGPVSPLLIGAGVGLGLAAGVLAGRGRLRGHSPGARDNGSGVVAALSAAAAAPLGAPIGIVITGAEEFGMVGARVFANLEASLGGLEVVNFDTLDQEGFLYLVSHNRPGAALAQAMEPHLHGLGLPTRQRRLPWGILVDSLPLARRGATAVTVGRLTWTTLRRIHTPNDGPKDLSLSTAEKVGKAIGKFDLSSVAE